MNPLEIHLAQIEGDTSTSAGSDQFAARLRARDVAAFDQTVRENWHQVHTMVHRLLGWDSDCEDVVQEVFMAAWQKIDRFRGDANFSTWLCAIAVNQCRKHKRRIGKQKSDFRELCQQTDRQPHDATPIHEQSLENQQRIESVFLALDKLNHKDRELIVLCCLEDKTIDEVCTVLKLKKNTLEVRLHRARKRLKLKLQQIINELKQ